jgi:hypothetical protein
MDARDRGRWVDGSARILLANLDAVDSANSAIEDSLLLPQARTYLLSTLPDSLRGLFLERIAAREGSLRGDEACEMTLWTYRAALAAPRDLRGPLLRTLLLPDG